MTDERFEEILSKSESSILDFKAELYDFSNDRDDIALAKFVKDVISFANTIREAPAYIIFGAKELQDNTKQKVGITKNIDDAIFQDKIKNKLYPIPNFNYSTKKINNLTFGILEFPIRQYEFPITSIVKLKGIVGIGIGPCKWERRSSYEFTGALAGAALMKNQISKKMENALALNDWLLPK